MCVWWGGGKGSCAYVGAYVFKARAWCVCGGGGRGRVHVLGLLVQGQGQVWVGGCIRVWATYVHACVGRVGGGV